MSAARLELVSSHGDQTLAGTRFVLHAAANATEEVVVRDAGVVFVEGQPVVTTNLSSAYELAQSNSTARKEGQPGRVFVATLPANFHPGYAILTTAFIDRRLKVVSGAPMKYASARNQLSLYSQTETEAARVHVESDVASGYALAQHPQQDLESQYLIGTFEGGRMLDLAVKQILAALQDLQPLDYERIGRSLGEQFRPSQPAHEVLAATVIQDVIIGTAESVLMSQVRMIRWQGLALLGYRFYEGKQSVPVEVSGDLGTHKQRLEEYGRRIASSELFSGRLEWVKSYAAQVLALMRLELEGGELERLPD